MKQNVFHPGPAALIKCVPSRADALILPAYAFEVGNAICPAVGASLTLNLEAFPERRGNFKEERKALISTCSFVPPPRPAAPFAAGESMAVGDPRGNERERQ